MFKSTHMLGIFMLGLVSAISMIFIGASSAWWISAFVMFFAMSCLGITVTFHRFLSHSSFQFRYKWMEKLFIILGTLGATGSPLAWVAIHKKHHRYSDTDDDPHGPHLGWKQFVTNYDNKINYRYVKRYLKDPFHRFLHSYGVAIIGLYYLLLLVTMGVYGVVFLGLIPQATNIFMGSASSYAMHYFGYRNFETGDDSRNVWWLAFITWGESWHNNHHAKPNSYTFNYKWWEFDISAAVIRLIAKPDTLK